MHGIGLAPKVSRVQRIAGFKVCGAKVFWRKVSVINVLVPGVKVLGV